MGKDEVELVRRTYDALNRRDTDGALRNLDTAIEWHMSAQFSRTERIFRGHAGIREVVALFDEALDAFRVEPTALHPAGDAVLAAVRASGRLRGTGDMTGYDIVNLWRFRDGRGSVVETYATLDEARAAVEMKPPSHSSDSMSADSTGRENR